MLTNNAIANRLINEKSPYLLQHAYNPVDWFPWGEEAFIKAKCEDKPIFLSIGYSTCHWCHVMAHETFESLDAAEVLNKYFISIKVDREERPDVDNIYMSACQAYTGSGGWPLSVCLDHEKRPFFVGTYYTKQAFKNILLRITDLWNKERTQLISQAKQLTEIIGRKRKISGYTSVEKARENAITYFTANFDNKNGGFSVAPKFPSPQNLLFLMDNYTINRDKNSLNMCETTLKAMKNGGIYDHIGGGFSRYSTDFKWLVPHFEKMLYDNSLLLIAYSKIYRITNDSFYADTAVEIANYLIRDMTHQKGAFFTAEDADSQGQEGLFYTFTFSEVKDILKDSALEFCFYFNITDKGNFEGRNILNNIGKLIPDNRKEFVNNCRKKLFDYRSKRIRPHRDEKILTSLNGLAISAFSFVGKVLNKPDYIKIAKKTAEFIDENLINKNEELLSLFFDTPGNISGFAEDYAFYIWGLLELYTATDEHKYLEHAVKLQNKFNEKFFDYDQGGFYLSGKSAEKLPIKTKELYDGAMPSANSVGLHNLLTLYTLTKENNYMEQFIKTIKYFSQDISHYPQGYIHSVSALMELKRKLPDINICNNNVCRPAAKTIDELISYF